MRELAKKLMAPVWCIVAGVVLNNMVPNSPPGDFWIAALFIWVMWVAIRRQMLEKVRRQEAAAKILRASDVSTLSPLEYEDYCALVLRDAGWDARTTALQDQGVDVLASLRGVKVAIQCKKYTHPVGNKAVQEVIAGRLYYGADIAIVVSPVPYTRSAKQLAASTRVLLLHHGQLASLEILVKIP